MHPSEKTRRMEKNATMAAFINTPKVTSGAHFLRMRDGGEREMGWTGLKAGRGIGGIGYRACLKS
jgi:hypothetical protein